MSCCLLVFPMKGNFASGKVIGVLDHCEEEASKLSLEPNREFNILFVCLFLVFFPLF